MPSTKVFSGNFLTGLFTIVLISACSDEPSDLNTPPPVPSANMKIVDILDKKTDLSQAFWTDIAYGRYEDNWLGTLKALHEQYLTDFPYERVDEWTQLAEAGDADAQYNLSFWVGSSGQYDLMGNNIGSHTPDPCLTEYWQNQAAQQKHGPALTWQFSGFLGGGKIGGPNRRIASFYFWTWSELRGFGIKNYKSSSEPALTDEEFAAWTEEYKTWDIRTDVWFEPKSCPGCTENCLTVVEKTVNH